MNQDQDPIQSILNSDKAIQKALIEKELALKSVFTSNNVDHILKAQDYLKKLNNKNEKSGGKSLLTDPYAFSGSGYRPRRITLSYAILENMAKVPLINAIINTRKEQVADFCTPQRDRFSTGFVIRPRQIISGDEKKLSKQQLQEIEKLTQFILDCGDTDRQFHGDDFDSFTRKLIQDSFTYDQGNFEIIRDNKGDVREFYAVDSTTMRISETWGEEDNPRYKNKLQDGYLPAYVQILQDRVLAEWFAWEMGWCVRNPSSSIRTFGYGKSELEILIDNVTAILNADQYNANYFKVGANPKGILRVQNLAPNKVDELRMQWQATMAGVRNSHKTLIVEAEKMDWVTTQQSNKDMEYSKYQEFLIKVACAVYKIDPAEINFPMSGSSDSRAMFEGNNEARLLYSKDKGLRPTLRAYQSWINKYIIGPKSDNKYEFAFVGIDSMSLEKENQAAQTAITNWATLNEIRRSKGMKDIKGGDIVLNPIMFQMLMSQQQGGGMGGGGPLPEEGGDEGSPFDEFEQEGSPFDEFEQEQTEDPFNKALETYLQKSFT